MKIQKQKKIQKIGVGQAKCQAHCQNAGHTMQNDSNTKQNVIRITHNVGPNTLNVCQGPKGGLEVPPRPQGTPPLPMYKLRQ